MKTLFTLAFMLLACSSEDPAATDPACEAGKVEACPCPGGSEGVQTCSSDGSRWGACNCEDATGGAAGIPGVGSPCTASDECEPPLNCVSGGTCVAGDIVRSGEECRENGPPCLLGLECVQTVPGGPTTCEAPAN